MRRGRGPLVAIGVLLIVSAAGYGALQMQRARFQRDQARREATLRMQLAMIRQALHSYESKTGRAPQSLDELVKSGVLPRLPIDPITGSDATWRVSTEQKVVVGDFGAESGAPETAVIGVHSGAPGRDSRGKPWSDY